LQVQKSILKHSALHTILKYSFALGLMLQVIATPKHSFGALTLPGKLIKTTSQDSLYVLPMRQYFAIRYYHIIKTTDFSLLNRNLNQRLNFRPNNGLGIGLGFSYRWAALDLGIVLPSTLRYRGDNPTTKFDLISSLYGKKHVFDLTLQYYEGYFLSNASRVFNGDIPPGLDDMRNDISSIDLTLSYLYVLNHSKFSFQSSFLADVIQKRSAGSFTFHGFASLYGLDADSALVQYDFNSDLNQQAHINALSNISLGTGIGYAHTFVLPGNLFITLSGAPLLALNASAATVNNPLYDNIEDARVNLRLFTRNAIGYNGKRFYAVFNLIYDNFFVGLGEQARFEYAPLKVKLFFGYRLGKIS
jgi:hypothetical protein